MPIRVQGERLSEGGSFRSTFRCSYGLGTIVTTARTWAFRARFRRQAFGWSGTRKAIERLNEALREIEHVAHSDPALAAEGAVLLLEKLSPAVGHIDSSSGALGNATAGVVETLVPLIAAAQVPRRVREKWLERLFDAIQDDDPPYIESLGEHWGALCADPAPPAHQETQAKQRTLQVLAGTVCPSQEDR